MHVWGECGRYMHVCMHARGSGVVVVHTHICMYGGECKRYVGRGAWGECGWRMGAGGTYTCSMGRRHIHMQHGQATHTHAAWAGDTYTCSMGRRHIHMQHGQAAHTHAAWTGRQAGRQAGRRHMHGGQAALAHAWTCAVGTYAYAWCTGECERHTHGGRRQEAHA
jgi:hypothetical protein